MLRVAILNGKNKNYDRDFSKLIEAISSPGVISGLNIVDGKIQPGKAFIQVKRANTDSFYCYAENTEEITVDVTWTKKIWLEVKQTNINDGSSNAPDGSGILEVKTWASYPELNFLKIASVVSWVVTDDRELITNIDDIINMIIDGLYNFGVSSVWSDSYAITLPNPPTAYEVGQTFRFQADVGNTWSATLNVNWLWAITIKKLHDQDLETWDIEAWQIVVVAYDWTNFQMNSQVAMIAEAETSKLTEKLLIVWEDWDAWDCLFNESMVTFAQATSSQNIGDVSWNTRVAIRAIWSWVAWNTLKLALAKIVSPSVNLKIRIQTDNAWNPSWTLVDANATAEIAPWSLTTSLADTTMTLADTITIAKWTVVRIVLFQWTYWSETVNWTNYYKLWYRNIHTTTRNIYNFNWTSRWSVVSISDSFTGTTINTWLWNVVQYSWTDITQNNNLIVPKPATWWLFNKYAKTVQSIASDDSDVFVLSAYITFSESYRERTQWLVAIYKDNNNYISFGSYPYWNTGWSWIKVAPRVVIGWVEKSADMQDLWTTWRFKLVYTKSTQTVVFYRRNWSAWASVYTLNSIDLWSWEYFGMISTASWTYTNTYTFDDFYFTTKDFTTQAPNFDNFPYILSDLLISSLLSKTDSDYSYKLPTNALRIAKENFTAWSIPTVSLPGSVINSIPSVSANTDLFLSWTPGKVSTTPWTNRYYVWKVLPDWINVRQNSKNLSQATQTAWASPYTYQNTLWFPIVMTITWWTVSQIAISRDWTNFFQVAWATNWQVALQPMDYVKITYSSVPTLTIFYQ